jgi:DNA-binding LacI/PurR family transcriptional regulator
VCRREGITALIVHSDPYAIRVAQACAETGVDVPGDLALVSYDDEIAHLGEPALTAVRPPKNHVGRLAVEVLVSRLLDGDRRPAQGVLVAPELVVRQSSLSSVRP